MHKGTYKTIVIICLIFSLINPTFSEVSSETCKENLRLDSKHINNSKDVSSGLYSTGFGCSELNSWDDSYGMPYEVDIQGDYAYIAAKYGGLVIMDISNLSTPTFIGQYEGEGYANDLCVQGDYVYTGFYGEGFAILDISNPENITKVGVYKEDNYYCYSVDVLGNLAFVANYNYGLDIFDVSDPQHLFRYDFGDRVTNVVANGSYAYVMMQSSFYLRVMNVSDPLTTYQITTYYGANSVF